MLANKYSLKNWVKSQKEVAYGDFIAFMDGDKEIKAEVLGFPHGNDSLICYRIPKSGKTDIVDFFDTIVYRIDKITNDECSCGAKYTSRPNYHLSFCDIGK